jgi:hypothetical protein
MPSISANAYRFMKVPPLTSARNLELLRDAQEVAAARAELRREHADAGAASDLIDSIEQVDDVETHGHRLGIVRQEKFAPNADIELRIRRHRRDIGITAAQTAPVDHISGKFSSAPGWRRPRTSQCAAECLVGIRGPAAELIQGASRGGDKLIVVSEDPVCLKVLETRQAAKIGKWRDIAEEELVRYRLSRLLLCNSEIAIGLKIAAVEFRGELNAFVDPFGTIEGAEHQSLAEDSIVDEVGREFVVNVNPVVEIGAILRRRLAAAEWNI